MSNAMILEGNWNKIKGKLRKRWGQLSDDDFPQLRGDAEQIVGSIQRKTGETRETIEKYLREAAGGSASAMDAATEAVRGFAQHASEAVQQKARQAAKHAADQARAGREKAEQYVCDRPGKSLLISLGVGLIAGAVIGLSMRTAKDAVEACDR